LAADGVVAAVSAAVHVHVYWVHVEVNFGVKDPQLNPPCDPRLAEAVSTGVPEASFAQKESWYVPFIKTKILSVLSLSKYQAAVALDPLAVAFMLRAWVPQVAQRSVVSESS
jgi:hypothetical protein